MRFRVVTSQGWLEIRGAQWPLSSMGVIQASPGSSRDERRPSTAQAMGDRAASGAGRGLSDGYGRCRVGCVSHQELHQHRTVRDVQHRKRGPTVGRASRLVSSPIGRKVVLVDTDRKVPDGQQLATKRPPPIVRLLKQAEDFEPDDGAAGATT